MKKTVPSSTANQAAPQTQDQDQPAGEEVTPRTDEKIIDLVPSLIKLKIILVPLDFSPPARKALQYAISFAEQFDAKITVLNVVEPAIYPTELGYVPVEIESLHKTMHNAAREKLTEMAQKDIPPRFLGETLVRVGTPYHEIVQVAQETKADLIVIATHGYTGIRHVLLGSTAERVVRHAPCPVLTVREREHDFV